MTRKAARGRKTAARARTSTARTQARTTTRTGRKTSSARASKTVTRLPRDSRGTPAKRAAAPAASRVNQVVEVEAIHEPLPARGYAAGEHDIKTAQHEDDEDTDWLGEDEDPRSQIVEGDDEWEPQSDDEW